MTYFIETKNLILREFRDTDVASIFKLDSNKEVHEYLGKKPIKTIKEAEGNTIIFSLTIQGKRYWSFCNYRKIFRKVYWLGRTKIK